MNARTLQRLAAVVDVDDLLARCLGNVEFLERVLLIFQSRCESDLCELEVAIQSADMLNVRRLAHRLKGACDSAGADRLGVRASELWTAANDESKDELAALFTLLRSDWKECSMNLPGGAIASQRS